MSVAHFLISSVVRIGFAVAVVATVVTLVRMKRK
jgi:hypothetical protein